MQLAKVERDLLLRSLQKVVGIIERRHTLPILLNLLIKKQEQELLFISTDLELQITTHFSMSCKSKNISITTAARKLLEVVRVLPTGEIILSLDSNKLTVQCGHSHFSLQTLDSSEFPILSVAPDYGPKLAVEQREFKNLLGLVHFAMGQQDVRHYLNGVLLLIENTSLTAVATDGHRLAIASIPIDTETNYFGSYELIIPRKTVLELQRLLEESIEIITIEQAPAQVRFTFGDIEIISKLIEGKFPDYRKVIPKGYKNAFTIGRMELQRSLQRAAVLTSEKFKGVHLLVSPGKINIYSHNNQQEEARDEIEIIYNGDTLDIGLNVKYLLDVLSNVKSDIFQISLNDASSSALLSLPGEYKGFKYLVMPMRI